jgi:hypothetical protein
MTIEIEITKLNFIKVNMLVYDARSRLLYLSHG